MKYLVYGVSMTVSRPTRKIKDGTKVVNDHYTCGNWKNQGSSVCNSNSVKAEITNEFVINKLIERVNNELLLKRVINNINKNKSSKLKLKLDEMNLVNKEIDKLNGKKNSIIELF